MTSIGKNPTSMTAGLAADMSVAAADDARLAKAQAAGNKKQHDRAELRKVAEEFESLFLGIVLKSMRQTVQESGLLDGGNAEDIYRSMLDDEYAKMMAAQRHTGIADNIEEFLLRSYGEGLQTETTIGKAAGIKAYQEAGQQVGLQNALKQARIDTSGTPSASVASEPGKTIFSQLSSLPKSL